MGVEMIVLVSFGEGVQKEAEKDRCRHSGLFVIKACSSTKSTWLMTV